MEGFIKSLVFKKSANPEKQGCYHLHNTVKWESIPMLSVISGKNGIGKSTFLKMMPLYVNRK